MYQIATDAEDDCAHVDERAAYLAERAAEYVTGYGIDAHEWDMRAMVDFVQHDDGLTVSRVDLAHAMLEAAYDRAKAWLRKADALESVSDIEYHRDAQQTALSLLAAITANDRGETYPTAWARRWLRDQGISAEGRCRIHEGGTQAPCMACQRDILAPTLVASVAISTADRKVA